MFLTAQNYRFGDNLEMMRLESALRFGTATDADIAQLQKLTAPAGPRAAASASQAMAPSAAADPALQPVLILPRRKKTPRHRSTDEENSQRLEALPGEAVPFAATARTVQQGARARTKVADKKLAAELKRRNLDKQVTIKVSNKGGKGGTAWQLHASRGI